MNDTSSLQFITDHVTLEHLHDGRIQVFTLMDMSRESLDSWVAKIKEMTLSWPADRSALLVNHFASKNAGMTPYFRAKMQELQRWQPNRTGYIAAIFPRTVTTQMVSIFLAASRRNIQVRIFFNREDAVSWLENMLISGHVSLGNLEGS
ncbi:MAG: hypothetical protein IT324_14365 [Anaerolineae bacterium]|nr:hypothetical protein [Anaerolineae bacterium]